MVCFSLGVYFTVGLSHHAMFLGQEIIKFDKIITNVGGVYVFNVNNADYGKFIALENGTYQFTANFYKTNQLVGGYLMKSHELVLVAVNGGHGTGSLAAIPDLKKGEQVYLQKLVLVDDNTPYHSSVSSFSGFLIHPET